ncbi:hypothetical protein HETIRDRAFT_430162 [Heterobasidion irregulare TC 32-1]|uniref:Uncharacterized protein n=1 Tax=Heterobasidion irregulare (strain TC 32-1) TaxID=747525 RepID=W4JTV6_HETIT|nr:uncharacterized protein HETIRDRAFT_430162 [Heterobasidion irregulare TC 32-1]ETW76884.1 hypothetical protein HETIRDRAFT_430162 [Heterobasidion irregulare TC 32-1]
MTIIHHHIQQDAPDSSPYVRMPSPHPAPVQTQYMRMLLALDAIPRVDNLLECFFTCLLLAEFVLFQGTFASLQSIKVDDGVDGINRSRPTCHTLCTTYLSDVRLSASMAITQVYFSMDMLRSWCIRDGLAVVEVERKLNLAPQQHIPVRVITTLANVIGAQGERFTDTSQATLIVTGVCTVVCGILTFFYSVCKLRRVRLDHIHEVGKERAGKHGEGRLEESKGHEPIRETSIGPRVRAF